MVKNILFLRNCGHCYKLLEAWHSIPLYGSVWKTWQNMAIRHKSSRIWLQTLQAGQRDTSPGLYLFTDSNRYLINAGENTLRHLQDSGLPMKCLNRILLTGSSINHIGGLTNMLLAAQTPIECPISVYGPPNIEAFLQNARRSFQYLSKFEFVNLKLINERISWHEVIHDDDDCRVFGCAISHEISGGNLNHIYPRLAISYGFTLSQSPRRVSLDSIREHGVSDDVFQKVVQECQKGNPISLPSGKVINPNDILLPPQRRQSFLVIDCPSKHVFEILSRFKQTDFFNEDLNTHIDLIIHMTPQEIWATQEYQSWIQSFSSDTKHLLMNNAMVANPFPTVFTFDKIFEKLNKEHPSVFPSLQYSLLEKGTVDSLNSSETVTIASPSLRYVFRPIRLEGFERSVLQTKTDNLLYKLRDREGAKPFISSDPSNDFEVVFLGTGSRVSSFLRNTSGILLNLRNKMSLLMDCGEGTYRQMCYHYGQNIDIILKQLQTIFISHMHIDHHLGLVNILLQRKRIMGDADHIRIIGPESLDQYLRYFELLSGESLNFRFSQFWWVKRSHGKKDGKSFSRSLGVSRISVVPTKHSDYSHALVLANNSWKLVYSADTRPCKQLIDAGQNATLLIHEATFEDQLFDRAKATSHCTVSEAIRCSELMKAEHTILTHFSSRHLFPCRSSSLPDRVTLAFDHMTVQQQDLGKLQSVMPGLERTVLHSQQGRRSRKKQKNSTIPLVTPEKKKTANS